MSIKIGPFGSERALLEPSRARALYYRMYGAARVGDKVRAGHILPLASASLPAEARILDAGCGMGFYSLRLARRFPHVIVQSLDLDAEKVACLAIMAERLGLKNLRAQQGTLQELDSQQRYDLALCVDVLEHIEQDGEAVERLANSLKPGAVLVVHVPQIQQRHYLPQPGDIRAWEHVRAGYSPAEISALLQRPGLEIARLRCTFGLAGALASDLDQHFHHVKPVWLFLLPWILLLAWLDTLLPHSQGNGLLIVAQKPAEGIH